jgi:hypothetical protein
MAVKQAETNIETQAISEKAYNFLTQRAKQSLRKLPRLPENTGP